MDFIDCFRNCINRNLSLIILCSLILGFFLPGVQILPDSSVNLLVGLVMFLACFKVDTGSLRQIAFVEVVLFYVLRYLLLPLVMFALAVVVFPQHVAPVLLLALMPVAVVAPAVVGLVSGNVAIVVALLVLSSLISPFLIFCFSSLLLSQYVQLDITGIFSAICCVVFLPLLLHLPLRRSIQAQQFVGRNGSCVSVLIIALTTIIVIAKRRDLILADPMLLIELLGLLFAQYSMFFLFALLVVAKFARRDLLSYVVSSGVNNNGLAVGLALLYLPPVSALYLILSEIPWLIGVVLIKKYFPGETAAGGAFQRLPIIKN